MSIVAYRVHSYRQTMDNDFLDLLEQAYLEGQIDGATVDLAYELMRSAGGQGDCSFSGWPTNTARELPFH